MQHFPLATKTLGLLNIEPGGLEIAAYPARCGIGRKAATDGRPRCQSHAHRVGPHGGVTGRGKPVKKPGIDFTVQRREHGLGVTAEQQEADPASADNAQIVPRLELAAGGYDLCRYGGQLRPVRQGSVHGLWRQRVCLDADVVQGGMGGRRREPVRYGEAGIEPSAEAEFAHDKCGLVRPAVREIVVSEKDVLGFG